MGSAARRGSRDGVVLRARRSNRARSSTCRALPTGTVVAMAEERIWTAAELEQLTPDERQRVFNEGVVTDLDQVSPEFLARVRAKGRALLEERGLLEPESDAG